MRKHGYHVGVFRNPGSLYGKVRPFVEMQAVSPTTEQFVSRVYLHEHLNPDYACAEMLREAVGLLPEH